MFCFHKWSKWSEPFKADAYLLFGQLRVIFVQSRKCLKCGKWDWRKC